MSRKVFSELKRDSRSLFKFDPGAVRFVSRCTGGTEYRDPGHAQHETGSYFAT